MENKTLTFEDWLKAARDYAESKLTARLLDHTRGCVETARKLAARFGVDADKAAAASYLHDIAKTFSHKEQAAMARRMGMSEADIDAHPLPVLHGFLAAHIAKQELGIDDPDILQAIECHSTGCAGMSDLAKVVFVADYIELTRSFPGAEELRSHGHVTLDQLTLAVLRRKLKHLLDGAMVIDPRAFECLNDLKDRVE